MRRRGNNRSDRHRHLRQQFSYLRTRRPKIKKCFVLRLRCDLPRTKTKLTKRMQYRNSRYLETTRATVIIATKPYRILHFALLGRDFGAFTLPIFGIGAVGTHNVDRRLPALRHRISVPAIQPRLIVHLLRAGMRVFKPWRTRSNRVCASRT
jgi:hypothetical protein